MPLANVLCTNARGECPMDEGNWHCEELIDLAMHRV